MSNQVLNSDIHPGMKDDPFGYCYFLPIVLLSESDWTNYYHLSAQMYQAMINQSETKNDLQ